MKKNQINKDGKPQGLWEFHYHPNGNISSKANFKDGKLHDYCEDYWANGDIRHKGNFKDDKQHDYWEHYHSNKTLTKEFHL